VLSGLSRSIPVNSKPKPSLLTGRHRKPGARFALSVLGWTVYFRVGFARGKLWLEQLAAQNVATRNPIFKRFPHSE
jgi:hypothetical protein